MKINKGNLKGMIVLSLLAVSAVTMNSCKIENPVHFVSSPDSELSAFFQMNDDSTASYQVMFRGAVILDYSSLGIIREDADFSKNLVLDSVSNIKTVSEEYTLPAGKKKTYSYTSNRRTYYLSAAESKKMNIEFRVSNDGVAFRYEFPGEKGDTLTILKEITSFNFIPGTKAFIQKMADAKTGWNLTQPSYEEHYTEVDSLENLPFNKAGWVFPALFNCGNFWILLSETTPDYNYCGCRLMQDTVNSVLTIGFPQKEEVFPGGGFLPGSDLPWNTPWRIIAVGDGLKPIVESTLGTDLANPSKLEDISFVRPGKAAWSWALLKDDSTVFKVQKRFIDYASRMNWEYCLIDTEWPGQIGYDKIKVLADYAKTKNVGIILWYNSSGDWNTTVLEPKSMLLSQEARYKEFSRLREMGIKGIKVDFFGGDGQSMMNYYQDIFRDAAHFGLMVNCHGATIPRGWQRTYPNLLTMEAVRGFEFVTFEQFNADMQPSHSCMLPFTRNVFDPMDFTPVCFSEVPGVKRITSNSFELALSVIFQSGIQHYAEIPSGMSSVPDYVKEFMKNIPSTWDETVFIDGYPGKFIVMARRSGSKWFIAGINGENSARQVSFDPAILGGQMAVREISDGDNNRSFSDSETTLSPGIKYEIEIKPYGGFVMETDQGS